MDDNEIKVKIKADKTEIDKAISDIQTKINQMRQVSSGMGGNSPIAQQYQERVSADLKRRLTQDLKNQNVEIEKMKSSYLDISKQLETANKAHKTTLDLLKQKDSLVTSIAQKEAQAANIQSALGMGGGFAGDGRGLPGLGGVAGRAAGLIGGGLLGGNLRRGAGVAAGLLSRAVGGIGSGIMGTAGLAGSALGFYGDFLMSQKRWESAQAGRSANVTQFGNQIRERAINEAGIEDLMFAPERGRTIDRSMDFFEQTKRGRDIRSLGKTVTGLGMIAGGTILTAKTGGLGGKIGMAGIAGGLSMLGSSEEAYYRLTGNRQALNQMTAEDTIKAYQNFELQERLRDPNAYYQKKFIGRNMDQMLGRQRSAGLSDAGFFGQTGFLRRGGGEFMYSQREAMQQQMVGAGGSGRTSGDLHLLALQAQRGLGMTNAGQAMGRLTGYLGQEESREAFINILSKGVSIGLDNSKYVEEQKGYFQQVTALASKVGGNAQDYVASLMAAGLEGDISMRGVQRSGDIYQGLQNMLNQQGGVTGAGRASVLGSNPAYAGIKGMDFVRFNQLKSADINVNSGEMKRFYEMAKKGGYTGSLEDFVSTRLRDQNQGLVAAFGDTEIGRGLQRGMDIGEERALSTDEMSNFIKYFSQMRGNEGLSEEDLRIKAKQFVGGRRIRRERERTSKVLERSVMGTRGGIPMRGAGGDQVSGILDEVLGGGDSISPLDPSTFSPVDRARLGTLGISGRTLDAGKQAQAKTQLSGLEGNMEEMVTKMFKTIDQTMADKVKMEAFAEAVNGGTQAMLKFMEAAGISHEASGFSSAANAQWNALTGLFSSGNSKKPMVKAK